VGGGRSSGGGWGTHHPGGGLVAGQALSLTQGRRATRRSYESLNATHLDPCSGGRPIQGHQARRQGMAPGPMEKMERRRPVGAYMIACGHVRHGRGGGMCRDNPAVTDVPAAPGGDEREAGYGEGVAVIDEHQGEYRAIPSPRGALCCGRGACSPRRGGLRLRFAGTVAASDGRSAGRPGEASKLRRAARRASCLYRTAFAQLIQAI